jgi:hypothetical protein
MLLGHLYVMRYLTYLTGNEVLGCYLKQKRMPVSNFFPLKEYVKQWNLLTSQNKRILAELKWTITYAINYVEHACYAPTHCIISR